MKNFVIFLICLILFSVLFLPLPASAGGSEPFLGETSLFAATFCPRGWTKADGQLLPINQNQALFSLFGTTYGGDGRTNFALPDLRGRAPAGDGQSSGLSPIIQGEKGGGESVILNVGQVPQHSHPLFGSNNTANQLSPGGNLFARPGRIFSYTSPGNGYMANSTIGNAGENQPQSINIRSPYLGMVWCVALQGIFPSRN